MLHIRPAREADREAVLAFTANTWEHGDYIGRIWDTWMADSAGVLLVGELDGQPVALTMVSCLTAGVDWYEGIRVAPEQRQRGLARAMLHYCIHDLARQRGVQTLRFFTASENTAMQRLAASLGFRTIAQMAVYHADALNGSAPALQTLPLHTLPTLEQMLHASPLLEQSGGLYTHDWRCERLSRERLHHHLQQGEVVAAATEPADAPRAWAIVATGRLRGAVRELRFVWGEGEHLKRLLHEVRRGEQPTERDYIAYAPLPPAPALVPHLAHGGFTESDLRVVCYELVRS
jgi:RimJ/RimL family protein N-acetyltransferase